MLDSKMQCLCCDRDVLVDSEKWKAKEMPVALCPTCAATVPMATVKVLYVMRSQIAMMSNELKLVRKDIGRLFKAQEELEQDLVSA